MLKSRKVRPAVRTNRYLGRDIDLGDEATVLVETPTARLVFVVGYAKTEGGAKRYVPARLVIVRSSGKIITLARKGRFDMARFAKLLSKIANQLKADVQIGDLDTHKRDFTTVFEEA